MTNKPKIRNEVAALIVITLFAFTFSSALVSAQPPDKMSYQAVVRNISNQLVVNAPIGVRISILQGSITGTEVFKEIYNPNPSTNDNGLVTIEIGSGIAMTGTFASIDWSDGPCFIKTEIDPAGGTNYSITGTSQLLSVPYALHAKSAETVIGGITETDPVFSAWDKSTGITITESQISDLGNYLETETDPIFILSPAFGITAGNIGSWSTAFGWGNHSGLYRSATWVPSWNEVTGKPSTFSPSAHIHSASDITSGTLPVMRGGTGTTSFISGDVLIGNSSGAITTLTRNGIDTRTDFPPAIHYHSATDITSGIFSIARIPTGTTASTVSLGNHTHGNITSDGQIGTVANKVVVTGAGGTLTTRAAGTTAQYLRGDGEWGTPVQQGTATGQMLYWNGSEWVIVPPGATGQVLAFVNGVPTWSGAIAGTMDVYNPATGKIWMDRNLGATQVATSSTDASSYGDIYQWGRAADGHQIRTSGTTATLSSSNTPGHGNFILASSTPYDWRNPQNDNLWQGITGANNPCPTGYRLPTEAELEVERLSWSSNNSAGAFASPLKLPVAGYRYLSTGSFINVGSGGDYWSSTISGTMSRSLYFQSSNAYMCSNHRALGISVRCLKDY